MTKTSRLPIGLKSYIPVSRTKPRSRNEVLVPGTRNEPGMMPASDELLPLLRRDRDRGRDRRELRHPGAVLLIARLVSGRSVVGDSCGPTAGRFEVASAASAWYRLRQGQ